MTCEKCASPTWSDDDLHWQWCENPRCTNAYGKNAERMRDYDAEIAHRERRRLEREGE
jgi:hypothetical protein